MKTLVQNYFSSMKPGGRALVLLYALGFPLWAVGHYTHSFELYEWLALSPPLLWKGEIWTAVTYAFLPSGVVDWVVSLFWLATLVSVLARDWSSVQLWAFCLLTTVVGAVALALFMPATRFAFAGNAAMIFGLLVAWYRLYGRERLILLGVGEISVRQAAVLIAFIEVLILVFCCGPIVTAAMLCGGVFGWSYLAVAGKRALSRHSQVVDSERVARLEL